MPCKRAARSSTKHDRSGRYPGCLEAWGLEDQVEGHQCCADVKALEQKLEALRQKSEEVKQRYIDITSRQCERRPQVEILHSGYPRNYACDYACNYTRPERPQWTPYIYDTLDAYSC